uniref:M superfamily MMSK group conopeptide Ec3-WP01 n=1 Tax=Conus emaciatus TaxID=89442 RepID=H2BKM1_CONEM|nr:M superfamily MMSK group conopeptide Ec3-WP01 [Conus emaciatus]
MMFKPGVLLIICMLLVPLTAYPMVGDQPADRMQNGNLRTTHLKRCCDDSECSYSCWPCCYG